MARLSLLFLILLIHLSGCSNARNSDKTPATVLVYAAASLATTLPQAAAQYESAHPQVKIDFNFAASSLLAKQIALGADADIYFSANPQWMDFLEREGVLVPGSRRDVLSNKLVVVVSGRNGGTPKALSDLASERVSQIAMGDWTHVPVGVYGKQALERAGLWQAVAAKCLPAFDARAALAYVERGDVACGVVYRSDAAISDKAKIGFEIPEPYQPDIRYPAALIRGGTQESLARQVLAFFSSPAAAGIYEAHGFTFINAGATD